MLLTCPSTPLAAAPAHQVFKLIDAARNNGLMARPLRPSLFTVHDRAVVALDLEAVQRWPEGPEELQEQAWYSIPAGVKATTAQADSFSIGVLLFEVGAPPCHLTYPGCHSVCWWLARV